MIRERALPLLANFVKALAAVAIRKGDEKIGVALLLGVLMSGSVRFGSVRSAVVGVTRFGRVVIYSDLSCTGFVGLFRTADWVALTFGQLIDLNSDVLHVILEMCMAHR